MSDQEKNAYILGTEQKELFRLGLQHQVWAGEARNGWEFAEFTSGQTILDLGCGPGYCTRDLAYMVGQEGLVLGIDKSEVYINFLDQMTRLHGVNIQSMCCDFDDMKLKDNSLDGMYCRWALAWISNPKEILEKIYEALKPGGVVVIHEYYDWGIFQTEPRLSNLAIGIKAALNSFLQSPGDINIGRRLPAIFEELDMDVIRMRPMNKLAMPDDLNWQWPKTFLHIYLPKLVEVGLLSANELELALKDLEELEYISGASILCPQMVELIAVKP